MAAKLKALLNAQENKHDITRNLPSLTFESALDEEEQRILYLRQQSHAHTTLVSASCSFLVSILNEVRQIRADLAKTSQQRRAIQLLTADTLPKNPLKIGLIGCGRLGSHLVHALLSFGEVNPADIQISTRRPETLNTLKEKGVSVIYNNIEVASKVHLLFVCVLPSQLNKVLEEICQNLDKQTLVYCLVNHTTSHRLKRLLQSVNIFIPSFVFDNSTSNAWNSCMSVEEALKDEQMVRKCCPLSNEGKGSCVHLTEKWVELVICAFINQCSDLQLTSRDALDLLHGICMGLDKLEKGTANRFVERDFIINWDDDDTEPRRFPKFDLSKIHENDSHVIKKLRTSQILQEGFTKKFLSVFRSHDDVHEQTDERN
ncbi:NADP-dependent oxidoreductase domain-containing protein 1-like [Watersipora subatra]|uniref:NADP-dependent oxidoreductase domain-containing protein 1-like n=1 Tax=Watersipora subatra TaxID=2589382 RepID=UPI00355AEE24